jgi:hypothetical protein
MCASWRCAREARTLSEEHKSEERRTGTDRRTTGLATATEDIVVRAAAWLRPSDPRLPQLTQLSRAFTNATSLADILHLAVQQAAVLMGAAKAVLMLSDADGMLRVRAAVGVEDDVMARFRQSFDESLVTRPTDSWAYRSWCRVASRVSWR